MYHVVDAAESDFGAIRWNSISISTSQLPLFSHEKLERMAVLLSSPRRSLITLHQDGKAFQRPSTSIRCEGYVCTVLRTYSTYGVLRTSFGVGPGSSTLCGTVQYRTDRTDLSGAY